MNIEICLAIIVLKFLFRADFLSIVQSGGEDGEANDAKDEDEKATAKSAEWNPVAFHDYRRLSCSQGACPDRAENPDGSPVCVNGSVTSTTWLDDIKDSIKGFLKAGNDSFVSKMVDLYFGDLSCVNTGSHIRK